MTTATEYPSTDLENKLRKSKRKIGRHGSAQLCVRWDHHYRPIHTSYHSSEMKKSVSPQDTKRHCHISKLMAISLSLSVSFVLSLFIFLIKLRCVSLYFSLTLSLSFFKFCSVALYLSPTLSLWPYIFQSQFFNFVPSLCLSL